MEAEVKYSRLQADVYLPARHRHISRERHH